MGIAIYVRVSTDDQRDKGHSITAQISKAQDIVQTQFDNAAATIYNDAGYSAKDLNRPNMKQLIIDITEQKIDTLIFYSLDRISRNLNDLMYFLHHAETNNCQLICITQDIAYDTPEQRMLVLMQGVFAQFEREKISERTKNGLAGGFEKGHYILSGAPYGYSKINKTLVVNVHQADIIQKIYYLYLDCSWSIHQIFQHFKKFPLDPNTNFYYEKIQKILSSSIYAGFYEYQGKRYTNFPAIIDRKKWDLVQKTLTTGTYSHTNHQQYTYIFKHKAICSRCKNTLVGQSTLKKSRPYLYYVCNNRQCSAYKKRLLEDKLTQQLENTMLSFHRAFFSESKTDILKRMNIAKMKTTFDQKIKDRTKKIEKLNIAYIEDNISQPELRSLKKKYNEEIDYYKTERNLLLNAITESKEFKSLTVQQKQKFVHKHMPKFEVDLVLKKVVS